jgi:hypothetical protein
VPGVPRPKLEIADIFRAHGPAWRRANAGHVSLTQLKVMSAIEACRSSSVKQMIRGIICSAERARRACGRLRPMRPLSHRL